MKDFFNQPETFFIFLLFVIVGFMTGGFQVSDHINSRRNYENYQRALTTILACRIVAKENADKVCGSVPNVKDFIEVAN